MSGRRFPAHLAKLQPRILILVALIGVACGADRIVSIDVGTGSHRVTAGIGDLVDIRLWGGAVGLYSSPPTISTPSVVFVDVSVQSSANGATNPGGPTQHFRFRAESRGVAVVTFTPLQEAPVISDTIVVQ